MRKIFGGAMLFSALGAAILGGALAWTNTEVSGINQVQVGSVDFGMLYVQAPSAQLGPDDGVNNEVGTGLVQNLGSLTIGYASGGVEILNVSVGHQACNTTNFGGAIRWIGQQTGSDLHTGEIGAFDVGMNVAPGAPDACQTALVSYVVFITMQTVPSQ